MSIRKHKGKIALSIAAAFWAACDNDSGNEPTFEIIKGNSCEEDEQAAGCQAIALYGVPSYDMSSAEVSGDCDEASGCAESSSSEALATESSSSEALAPASSSVNSEYPYVSGIHPSLHCKDSTAHHYSTCPRSKPVAKVVEDFENMPLEYGVVPVYGVIYPVCQDKDYDYSVFKCEDGSVYPDNSEFKVVDGVLTQYEFVHGDYVPAKEAFAKETEESEASAKYPYQVAQDTTVNCKAVVTTEIRKVSWAVGNYDQLQRKYTYKCTDGKEYKHDELRQTEEGNLYTHKETEN